MNRRSRALITGLSVLIFIALSAMWARSLWRYDRLLVTSTRQVSDHWAGTELTLRSLHGGISWEHIRVEFNPANPPPVEYRGVVRGPQWFSAPTGQIRLGQMGGPLRWVGIGVAADPVVFTSLSGPVTAHGTRTTVILPYWLLVLIAGIIPGLRLARRARTSYRMRFRPGRCAKCGYDLRASRERCPECGALVTFPPRPGPNRNPVGVPARRESGEERDQDQDSKWGRVYTPPPVR